MKETMTISCMRGRARTDIGRNHGRECIRLVFHDKTIGGIFSRRVARLPQCALNSFAAANCVVDQDKDIPLRLMCESDVSGIEAG